MPNDEPASTTANRQGILVIGAGELGTNVLSALHRRKSRELDHSELAVLLRPSSAPERVQLRKEFADKGITVEDADVSRASSAELVAAMSRFHTVVSCVGFAAGAGTQRKLTEAALAAAVPRYIPWQFGCDYDAIGRGSPQDLFDEQLDVRDLLRAQRTTEWIIVSTGMFTSFLFDPRFGVVDIDEPAVHALGSWDTQVTVTTAEDIGILTAEILYSTEPFANQAVYVAGDTLSYGELADIVERVRGVPVTRTEWTVDHLLDALQKRPADTMAKYRAVFAQGKGVAWPKDHSFNATNGFPTTSAAEWAATHIARSPTKGPAMPATTDSDPSVLDRLRDAIDSGDARRVADCFTDDFRAELPHHPERSFIGAERVYANWTAIFEKTPALTAKVLRSAVNGAEIWSEWEIAGVDTAGTPVTFAGPVIVTTRAGQINSARFYLDPVAPKTG